MFLVIKSRGPGCILAGSMATERTLHVAIRDVVIKRSWTGMAGAVPRGFIYPMNSAKRDLGRHHQAVREWSSNQR